MTSCCVCGVSYKECVFVTCSDSSLLPSAYAPDHRVAHDGISASLQTKDADDVVHLCSLKNIISGSVL